ncbi:MAG: hypothetical protein KDA24_27575, partial [Deltaproteobacteria bacterium]|nr:hypothetical protein [Deltaproteobacteria bacterium]
LISRQLIPPEWTEDDLVRALPLLQALADGGEPLVFADQITRRRDTAPHTHVAMLMALDDTIVPNAATTRLAQALQVEIVGQVLLDMPGVANVDGPVRGNLADGATGALLQLEEVQSSEGAGWTKATHLNVPTSWQWETLVDTLVAAWVSEEPPEVDGLETGGD